MLTPNSACVCSIVRLFYAIKLYGATDITYHSWYTKLWTAPEVASGIVVACLPLLPKFFQGLKEMGTLSKIGSALKSPLNLTIIAGRRSTDDHSAENHTSLNAPTFRSTILRPGQYKTLSDREPLAKRSHGFLADTTFGDEEYIQAEAHIMRTIDTHTQSESKSHT